MKKLIHVLNINDFFPELFALTFPTIQAYAERHGFLINLITERKFHDYPINYEKMQVYQDGREAELNMLCDADMLIHPHFPDVHEIVKNPAYVAFNDNYNISTKYQANRIPYFVRDGRDVGIATNFVVTSNLTHDLWEPIPLTSQQISDLAVPNNDEPGEWNRGWGHYADEFALSFNLAKYGLKYQGICPEDWQRPFLIHVGTGDKPKSLRIARETLAQWATL